MIVIETDVSIYQCRLMSLDSAIQYVHDNINSAKYSKSRYIRIYTVDNYEEFYQIIKNNIHNIGKHYSTETTQYKISLLKRFAYSSARTASFRSSSTYLKK